MRSPKPDKRRQRCQNPGILSISEVAYQVGFADQSYLTYHVKKFYGLTPKMPHLKQTPAKQPQESPRVLPI